MSELALNQLFSVLLTKYRYTQAKATLQRASLRDKLGTQRVGKIHNGHIQGSLIGDTHSSVDENRTNMSLSKLKKLLLIENAMLKFNTIQNRRCWIHDLSRPLHGEFESLYKELRRYDNKFHSYLCMNQDTFDILLEKLKVKLQKKDTAFRYFITPEERPLKPLPTVFLV